MLKEKTLIKLSLQEEMKWHDFYLKFPEPKCIYTIFDPTSNK